MSPITLFPEVSADALAVDAVIRKALHSDVALIRQVADYIVLAGGKRLRPVLLLLSARAAGYRGDAHATLAAVIEFIHTATLLHDDVVDESALRRGRRTANAVFGNAASVLVGDFLYSRAFQMMVSVGNMPVLSTLADATNTIAEGEVLQLMHCRDADLDVGRYLQVIRFKTAKLFEAAARIGAQLAGLPPAAEQGMAQFGLHVGTAFQLIDDVLDYSGDESQTGKHLGDDLAEGKATLPLIHTMRHGSPAQAQLVRDAIEHGGRDDLTAIVAAIEATGALDETRRIAGREVELAIAALPPLAEPTLRESLIRFAAFSVDRNH